MLEPTEKHKRNVSQFAVVNFRLPIEMNFLILITIYIDK